MIPRLHRVTDRMTHSFSVLTPLSGWALRHGSDRVRISLRTPCQSLLCDHASRVAELLKARWAILHHCQLRDGFVAHGRRVNLERDL
jgi:hypothetical protein